MTTRKRIAAGIIAALVIVVAFVIARPDGNSSTDSNEVATPTAPTSSTGSTADVAAHKDRPKVDQNVIVVKNGKPVGGVEKITVDKGDKIKFTVRSDVSDEVHFHGYDISKEVGPGESAKFSVPATLDGIYEVELEQRAVPIAEIRVNP